MNKKGKWAINPQGNWRPYSAFSLTSSNRVGCKRSRVIGRIMPSSKRCPPPNPGTCQCVTLRGKRDFADVIKLKNLETGSVSGTIQVGPSSYMRIKMGNIFWLWWVRDRGSLKRPPHPLAGSEMWGSVPRTRERPLEAGNGRETHCPLEPSGRNSPPPTSQFQSPETQVGFLTSRTVRS